MKIDFSTVFLVIICVIPGLFAQRSRNLVCPRSFDSQGSSAELGELVALGVSTHGILACLSAVILCLIGICRGGEPSHYFRILDSISWAEWCSSHLTLTIISGATYVFVSFAASHWLGLFYGVWRQRSPITTAVLARSKWLKRHGITGLLGEQPIIYMALNPRIDADGNPYLVFLEVEMKSEGGFYSGQLREFAIVKDEEPHKPVFLINTWFKKNASEPYVELPADGVMLDLADAVTLFVKQVARDLE